MMFEPVDFPTKLTESKTHLMPSPWRTETPESHRTQN